MRYKHVIAFLGKKRLQDYTPKSRWIKLSENGNVIQEAIEKSGVKLDPRRGVDTAYYMHTDAMGFRIGRGTGWDLNRVNWDFYYRPDIDLLFVYPDYNRNKQNVEAVLDYLNNMTLDEIKALVGEPLPNELHK